MSEVGYRAYVSEEVISGEAVAIETPSASLPQRAGGFMIDAIATVLLVILLVWGVTTLGVTASEAVLQILAILTMVAVLVAIPAAIERLTLGRSLGKAILGMRVVRDDGGPITTRHALTRALIGVVELWTTSGAGAATAALIHPRAKRLGDMAAGTYVISPRIKAPVLDVVGMPMHLAPWAATADISTLPPGLAIAIRQFLARRFTLTPQSRAQVGQNLLAATLPCVAPQPPAGVFGEDILAAVLAERRRRDEQRIARDQALRYRVIPADRG